MENETGFPKKWNWFHPTESSLLYYRPTYQYDSHLCKRVSNESRALVHEISELLGKEDAEVHSKLYPLRPTPSRLKPRMHPNQVKKANFTSREKRIRIDLNINSYPRPFEVAPKLLVKTPDIFCQGASSDDKVSPVIHDANVTTSTNIYTSNIKQKYEVNSPAKKKNTYKQTFKFYSSPK